MKDLSKREQAALRKKGRENYRLRQRRKIIDEENDVVQALMNVKAEFHQMLILIQQWIWKILRTLRRI